MNRHPALAWLESRPDFELRPTAEQAAARFPLERPAALLEATGRPDRAYRVILVAGTKGKGSTAAFLAAVLGAHGLRVGLYSQPHLHTFRERLRIGDELITSDELAESAERLRPLAERIESQRPKLGQLTAYELTTVLGLVWFAEQGVDWAVLEVGLGGRLDATNIVTPAVAVITPISYDHTHVLGKTLPRIAAEKAGIIKAGGRVVSAPQRPAALAAIRRVARAQAARLTVVGHSKGSPQANAVQPLRLEADAPSLPTEPFFQFKLRSDMYDYGLVDIHLGGAHQLTNALTAVAALEAARSHGLRLEVAAVAQGLAATRWPGRMELVRTRPAVVLDGAHNGDSAERLREALELHFRYERLHLVLGVFADKDLAAILRPFGGAASLTAVQVASPRARVAAEVARAARRLGIQTTEADDTAPALRKVVRAARPQDLVCVTGSLAVVAAAREALGQAKSSGRVCTVRC